MDKIKTCQEYKAIEFNRICNINCTKFNSVHAIFTVLHVICEKKGNKSQVCGHYVRNIAKG